MSEQSNVQVVQDAYAAFGRGDIQGILDRCSEDIDWRTFGPDTIRETKPRRGKQEVQQFFGEVNADWDFTTFEPGQYIAQGDHVICLGRYTGTSKATGRSFTAEWAMHFQLRDGKVTRFREYTDTAQLVSALETRAARAGA
jgi:uncharacterized protein